MKILSNEEYKKLLDNQKDSVKPPLKKFRVTLATGEVKVHACNGWETSGRGLKLITDEQVIALYTDYKSVELIVKKPNSHNE